ncbi:hypothetical protein QO012_001116 [Methylobacterium aerolatum]|uniref:Uncharacterized protein n=1 Tax=Methylobacterium aerolatum TaxID=418708 RepID=A0ABU0HWB5_9HYPH|nr:hypothetical protein [Methylobacterium aerolatum]GJD33213.1 hypothetical protein FMGBMHLM_0099 [Methylobacterium aerolatum]
MLHDDLDGPRTRMIDNALLCAAFVSLCFGLTAMMAGLLR